MMYLYRILFIRHGNRCMNSRDTYVTIVIIMAPIKSRDARMSKFNEQAKQFVFLLAELFLSSPEKLNVRKKANQ